MLVIKESLFCTSANCGEMNLIAVISFVTILARTLKVLFYSNLTSADAWEFEYKCMF